MFIKMLFVLVFRMVFFRFFIGESIMVEFDIKFVVKIGVEVLNK